MWVCHHRDYAENFAGAVDRLLICNSNLIISLRNLILDMFTRAVVDTLSSTVSRQSRLFDCRQATIAVSTENSLN